MVQLLQEDVPGVLHDPFKDWPNSDLLIDEEDQAYFTRHYPAFAPIFDWPQLRALFVVYDNTAARARKHSRRAGIFAVVAGFLSLTVAAGVPLAGALTKTDPHQSNVQALLGGIAASLALISVLIGYTQVLLAKRRRDGFKIDSGPNVSGNCIFNSSSITYPPSWPLRRKQTLFSVGLPSERQSWTNSNTTTSAKRTIKSIISSSMRQRAVRGSKRRGNTRPPPRPVRLSSTPSLPSSSAKDSASSSDTRIESSGADCALQRRSLNGFCNYRIRSLLCCFWRRSRQVLAQSSPIEKS